MCSWKERRKLYSAFSRIGFIFVASDEVFEKIESKVSKVEAEGNPEMQASVVLQVLEEIGSDNFSAFTLPAPSF
jgi:hypothetical protein